MDGTTPPVTPAQWARTKIVATVGPACGEVEQLTALVHAGADVFRINMAHGGPEAQQVFVDRIRQVSKELGQPLAILVDLGGPKIRLGELPGESIFCRRGDEFFFVEGEPATANELTSTYEPLLRELSVGDLVMLADGTVAMRTEEVKRDRVRLRVVQQGTIRSRQGINLPDVKLSAPAISIEDHQHALWA
ncbi:MAG: pyruvate kinase, partial [Pirellulales bacterium]|nr:pyruvate kinase [Pirellulales bacterium]